MKTVLITGVSGFVGFHVAHTLLERGDRVIGLDNMNTYYDITLKEQRLAILREKEAFSFILGSIEDRSHICDIIEKGNFDAVIHLAAQAGVRYSLTHPQEYISSNLVGFFNVIDACKEHGIPHFLYASSSSVYGANEEMPFSENDKVDRPISLYAATKKSNELIAYSYSHLYQLKTTGFRFFSVYGPYGRPDMAPLKFTKNIYENKPIQVFNYGDMQRDFTYIDDIVKGILVLLERSASLTGCDVPYQIYNIGNSQPVNLMDFIQALEKAIGKKAIIEFLPMQPGDVKATYADISKIKTDGGFEPTTSLQEGVDKFVAWYIESIRGNSTRP
ncbi:GDP-mannose 4,6-dehydratase [Eubacteriales bacterium OttesenSCG-928-M02]|nr:GDP-mannose 4,6-dehydratase [Eubacteriales bacterium OttesenSCG-928-M02]